LEQTVYKTDYAVTLTHLCPILLSVYQYLTLTLLSIDTELFSLLPQSSDSWSKFRIF